MTKEQAIWASQHDWYLYRYTLSASNTIWYIRVLCSENNKCLTFCDFDKLRSWAGY